MFEKNSLKTIFDLIEKEQVQFLDLRFSDLRGKEHHISFPIARVNEALFTDGKVFDGSSIEGWASIDKSDMLLKPIIDSVVIDPFFESKTLIVRCNVFEPQTMLPYNRDPRAVALRAEEYLKKTGIADVAYMGHEVEFFIFDDVRWSVDMHNVSYTIDSEEGAWNTNTVMEQGNMGYRPAIKGGYFPVPPMDSSHDLRSEMCLMLEQMGLIPEVHHHEVATANQNEITTRYCSLTKKCDEAQTFKYCIRNVALSYGKTVTFMPKPLVGDNGSAMHTHQSLAKDGKNLFSGDAYAGLSELAIYYIGGILKHARALNAFTNPTTNSYKRLVPGYEAPVKLAYSASNRSAAIRIPFVTQAVEKRIEVRFPDPLANPYLAFSAMLMAGLDGIKNKIHPGEALDKDLYHLSKEEAGRVPDMCGSLREAIDALKADSAFLLEGGVFTPEILEAYIGLKEQEISRLNMTTHPVEFDMYYSL
ncbi:MAG: type I glutamate--ammonia ligase [Gammaproteobacteria bacterium]|nr:type I glutamate--ammonia ligase [Gammaproteobacteria bacterium]